jgi:hemoglobin/transferrin/lactoferrin receptor protein
MRSIRRSTASSSAIWRPPASGRKTAPSLTWAARTVALLLGAEWYEDEQTGFDSNTPNNQRGGVPSGTTSFTGAWAQLETTFDLGAAGELIVLPGVRFDSFESDSDVGGANEDDAVSPRIAATWAPNEQFRVFASWSEAFRAPSLNELYLSDTHFSSAAPGAWVSRPSSAMSSSPIPI